MQACAYVSAHLHLYLYAMHMSSCEYAYIFVGICLCISLHRRMHLCVHDVYVYVPEYENAPVYAHIYICVRVGEGRSQAGVDAERLHMLHGC